MVKEQMHLESTERWAEVREFPNYSISDYGRVLNDRGMFLKATLNTRGNVIVGFMRNGIHMKRSITLLVAQSFLPRPEREDFIVPINMDGEKTNNHYSNLTWRPLWFARKYVQQFHDNHPTIHDPVEDIHTREVYQNSMHAAICNGLLDKRLVLAILNRERVWPTGQEFREVI